MVVVVGGGGGGIGILKCHSSVLETDSDLHLKGKGVVQAEDCLYEDVQVILRFRMRCFANSV